MFRWILACVGLLGFVQCHTELDNIVDDFWQWRMQNNPEFASNVGNQDYTEDVEDYSIGAIATRKVAMDGFMSRLGTLDRNSMPFADRVTYDVLKDTIQTWLNGYAWKDYGPMNPINILEGIHSSLGSKAGQVKFETEDDFNEFSARIGKFGTQVTQVIERMNRAIQMNTTNHKDSVEGVPEKIKTDVLDMYMNNKTAIPLYEPFKSTLDGIVTDQSTKQEIRNRALANITDLLTKLGNLRTFLINDYIPKTRTSFGVWGLPRGADYYAACLKWQLSVNLTADEIYNIGVKEVERVHKKIQTIMKNDNFDGTVKEYNDHLRGNADLFIEDPDEALEHFRNIHKTRIVPKLDRMFKDIPKMTVKIEKMPYNGPNGIYKNGAPDGSRAGVFWANVNSAVPKFDLVALLLHETDPGHHLQDAYALTASEIPMFRKAVDFSKYFAVPLHFPFYTAYSEGWGLYSEDLGEDLDIYKNDLERFGKFGLEIFRAARLVVDTGIHAKRWSKQQAIDYMKNYTAYKEDFITREINRYSTWPAQATSYMIGKIKIRDLREYASIKLCALFNIKDFHNIILKNGAMPLGVMESLVKEWVEQVRADNDLTGNDCSHTWSSGVGPIQGTTWILAVSVYIAYTLF